MPVLVIVIIAVIVVGAGTAVVVPALVSDPQPPAPADSTRVELRAPLEPGTGLEFYSPAPDGTGVGAYQGELLPFASTYDAVTDGDSTSPAQAASGARAATWLTPSEPEPTRTSGLIGGLPGR